ncbi:hypothetical protein M3J09_013377 [Ascochyta lentis]
MNSTKKIQRTKPVHSSLSSVPYAPATETKCLLPPHTNPTGSSSYLPHEPSKHANLNETSRWKFAERQCETSYPSSSIARVTPDFLDAGGAR